MIPHFLLFMVGFIALLVGGCWVASVIAKKFK
jgi:hypothetical protein